MKRWTPIVVLLLLATALVIPSPAMASQHVRIDTGAYADWLLPTARAHRFTWYTADAMKFEYLDTGDQMLIAGVAKGTCRVKHGDGFTSISCIGRGYSMDSKPVFSTDATASTATLDVHERGSLNHIAWSTDSTAGEIYSADEACSGPEGNGSGTGNGLFREASAIGHIFGRKLASVGRYDTADIEKGLMITSCEPMLSRAQLMKMARGGRISMHWTVASN